MSAQPKLSPEPNAQPAAGVSTQRLIVGLPSDLLRQAGEHVDVGMGRAMNELLLEALLTWLFWMESRPVVDVYVAQQRELEWLALDVPRPVMLRWLRAVSLGALNEEDGEFQCVGLPARSFSGSLCCALEMFLEDMAEA